MKRARVIIKEINITKQGEVHHFQMKLPKNAIRIIAVETDVRIDAIDKKAVETSAVATAEIIPKLKIITPMQRSNIMLASTLELSAINVKNPLPPFLSWTRTKNPTLGRLKLQSLERANIFYEEWVTFVWLNGGIEDMSYGLFPISPYTLNKNTMPRKVDVPNTTTVINGLFTDSIGMYLKQNLTYTIKIFVWVETTEDNDGVVFDFQRFI